MIVGVLSVQEETKEQDKKTRRDITATMYLALIFCNAIMMCTLKHRTSGTGLSETPAYPLR